MMELSVNNLIKYLDATEVFKGISFSVFDGEKVGIVGVNGSGKSTILKVIAGIEEITRDDKGWISIPKGATIAYLEQIPPCKDNINVLDVLNEAFQELSLMEAKLRELENKMKALEGESLEKALREYSTLQTVYESKGGYDKEEKLSRVCTGLKLKEKFLNKDFNILSGGEKTTVMLGKILLQEPDILLLDEPTNHLDMESVEWLEGYLKAYRGIVLIVSHDRYFLDNVVTKIIEFEDMFCETYKGNYSDYIRQKEENMLIQFNNYKEQQKKIKAMEKAIKDLREWAIRADNNKFFKRAASMQKSLDKMEKIDKPKFENENMKLNFNETERSGKDVIKVEGLTKGFKDKELFKDAELLINFSERIALIGSNGCGKTTFLKILLGEEDADLGIAKLGESVKVAYLPQSISFNDEEATVLETFREDFMILEGKAREYLSKFMFFGGTVFKKVKHLSGGERIRLKLSKLLYDDINLLILDEPTNHLDIESIENLEEALGRFRGTILFISHDRFFINRMSSRVIEIENQNFNSFVGNYDDYKYEKEKIINEVVKVEKVKKEKVKVITPLNIRKKLEKQITEIEVKVSVLEENLKSLDEKMHKLGSNYVELEELSRLKGENENTLVQLMELWEQLSKELEVVN